MSAGETSCPLFCEMVKEIQARKAYIEALYDDQKSKMGIYQIRCLVDGRVYVGSTVNFRKRWSGEKRALTGSGEYISQRLQKAWNEYGPKAFVWEILEYVYDSELLRVFEDNYLDQLKAANRKFGFNIKPSSGHQSEETRRQISESNLGKKMSPEARQRMREARLGKKYSELGREKPSDEVKQRICEGNLGVRCSEETRQRMSEAKLGTELKEEHKQKIRKSVLAGKIRDGVADCQTQNRVRSRFSGTRVYRSGSQSSICYRKQRVYFPMVKREIEAALMYFYAGVILFKDFVCIDYFPPEEMPSEERQEELWRMVIKKLIDVGLLGS